MLDGYFLSNNKISSEYKKWVIDLLSKDITIINDCEELASQINNKHKDSNPYYEDDNSEAV